MTAEEGAIREAAMEPERPGGLPALDLGSLLKYLPGVGPRRAELLEKLGLLTVDDLLRHLPRRYEDRRELRRIADAAPGEAQTFYGELATVRERTLSGGRTLIEGRLVDVASPGKLPGAIQLVWFNQPYLLEWLRPGIRLHAHGTVRWHRRALQMQAPEFELETADEDAGEDGSPHLGRIVPVYGLTKGIQQRLLRRLVWRVLSSRLAIPAGPAQHFHPRGLASFEACASLHFPASWRALEEARQVFRFEEYFAFASHLAFRRQASRESGATPFVVAPDLDAKIRSVLPFTLTLEQDRVAAEIARDLGRDVPMYRLLQGDVGTGKTAVAIYAMLVAVRNRHQAALMAPTEVLAEQHFHTVRRILEKHPVRVVLLTGSVRGEERREALEGLASGRAHIAVGTQALIQEGVRFGRLGLVVIDEQHRFGVLDRQRIRKKGSNPHLLVMTATPIPRSLCLTCYGDLDLSVIEARPAGRKPVRTVLVKDRDRPRAMEFIRKELAAGRQAYFIYPLIDESEALALPAAVQARQHLQERVFPEHRVGLVHGGLPPHEKEAALDRFRRGEDQVLVATVVVEVGIDVPNASVLFIEDATRFGLAQLHQLRGRVGRGEHASYCFVGLPGRSREAEARLKILAATEDGFRIAEEDLKLRGPGDYLGVRQSGRPHFLVGNPLADLPAFLRVKRLAEGFWADPDNAGYRALWARCLGGGQGEAEERQFLGFD
jgi:ATP-dependent DNA helicase RecG